MRFFIILIIILIIHETSHFIVAKLCKCQVESFSIGLGRAILKKKIGDTIYQLGWFLLGGRCKLKDELSFSTDSNGFSNLPYFKKILISIAGCSSNILVGIITLQISNLTNNNPLYFFSILSIGLGLFNILPIAPCLDGGYIVYLPLFIKKWGYEKGLSIFTKTVKISLKMLIGIDIVILCIIIKTGYYKILIDFFHLF